MEWFDLLRNAYNREIERIAEELRPRIVSREMGGYILKDVVCGDTEEEAATCLRPLDLLQLEVGRRLAPAEAEGEGGLLALAVTPSGWTYGDAKDPDREAGVTGAMDVLRVALARGWYVPRPEEYPSAEDLALEVSYAA